MLVVSEWSTLPWHYLVLLVVSPFIHLIQCQICKCDTEVNENRLNSLIRKQNVLHAFIIFLVKQDNRLHVFMASLLGDPVWQRPLYFQCRHLLPSGVERMLVHLCHVLNWSEMQTTIDLNYLFTSPVVTWEKFVRTNNHTKYKISLLTTVLRYSIDIFTHTLQYI